MEIKVLGTGVQAVKHCTKPQNKLFQNWAAMQL